MARADALPWGCVSAGWQCFRYPDSFFAIQCRRAGVLAQDDVSGPLAYDGIVLPGFAAVSFPSRDALPGLLQNHPLRPFAAR